ncbi:2-(3-amino-3-carboxypropyl)histidine synthase subunit 2 [Aplysia californica]|uniref:2-(3-amino-3-carboxypropyl)histidine synthase subunit 2 n=1 Tax=Aplysia californica TaxID=6500 RepID=A0ABM0K0H8_APLCA|nr:2-(3-amino-3-carboxypropyl)histidine synthase subunit 2 [Aplysia californica]
MATAFNSSDDVIERKIQVTSTGTASEALSDVYEISRSVQWILKGDFKRVALQFPDELLVDAPAVATKIHSEASEALVFLLGDTSYGSCCVDEVGAQHYKADCIIHYGHACLSPTTRLPVLYVFGRSPIDVQDCTTKIIQVCSEVGKTVLFFDTTYCHAIDEIDQILQQTSVPPVLAELRIPKGLKSTAVLAESAGPLQKDVDASEACLPSVVDSSKSVMCACGRKITLPDGDKIEDYSMIFIGDPSCATLINLMMTFNKCQFYTYNPSTLCCQRETLQVNKALMKRYYLIERVKDASIVGIVAGTLGIAKYKEVMDHVKSLFKAAGKKSYTFVVGKLNPAKLANFAEVDVYVLVACPESSLLDLSDFYRPVVTPLEVEFALNKAREWTGAYSSDFQELLPGGSLYVEAGESFDEDGTADVSLISNKVRYLGVRTAPEVSSVPSKEMVLRSDALAVSSVAENAGEFLINRSWQGLERKLGETPVAKAVEGTSGIAASYQHEPGT